MSLKRPSLAIHKVPVVGNKKVKNLHSHRVPRTESPQHLHGHPTGVPGNHTGRHGREARHRHRAGCVTRPHFNTSHLSCDMTRATTRGESPGRQDVRPAAVWLVTLT